MRIKYLLKWHLASGILSGLSGSKLRNRASKQQKALMNDSDEHGTILILISYGYWYRSASPAIACFGRGAHLLEDDLYCQCS